MEFKNKDQERWFNQMRFGIYGTDEEIKENLPVAFIVVFVVAVFAIAAFLILK